MKPYNPARRTSNVWWGITAASVFLIFLPSIIGLEGFDGGFAISFVAFILVIIGLIVAIVYLMRANSLDALLSGKNLLAHWTYTPEEWSEYTQQEKKREQSSKKALFILISVMALVIGGAFFLFDPEAGMWVFVSMLGLIAILGFTAWVTTWYNHRQNVKYLGEAYIAHNAVYLNRQFHTWNSPGSWLGSVKIVGEKIPTLEITYMALTRTIVQEYTVAVPIPRGKEKEAQELLSKFKTGKE